jgi:hypothetical protein
MTSKQASHTATGQADKQSDKHAKKSKPPRDAEQAPADLLAKRLEEAADMADGPTMTVTLRIPVELNRWLDEYVHRAWPERVKKQDLVTEGLRMLFARRGRPGETLLATDLLGGDDQ